MINQTINIFSGVRSIAMTQDHSYLVVGTYGYYVHVFKHDGMEFNGFQSFNYSNGRAKFVSITDDHQYLTVTNRGEFEIYRYFLNETS